MTAENELRAAVDRYRTAPQRARQERDQSLREIAKKYRLRQVDIINLTGYSRETVRQALAEPATPAPPKTAAPRRPRRVDN
jgi:hypothetical protein